MLILQPTNSRQKPKLHSKRLFVKFLSIFIVIGLLSPLLLLLASPAMAGAPAVQTFFLSMPENEVRTAFLAIDTGNGSLSNTMVSITSIAVTVDGTVIYYDQWEDGYEAAIDNPVQASTLIFGDGNTANGNACTYAATLCTNDVLKAGAVLALRNNVPSNPRGTSVAFDAHDKVAVTQLVAVTRAQWDATVGTVLAGALQVYDTTGYGTDFRLPVGEPASLSLIRYPSSDIQIGSWTTRNPASPATNWDKIDDPAPASSHDGDTTYIQASGTTEYQAGAANPTVPANATNISVSILWTARDTGSNNNDTTARLRVNGTYYSAGSTHNPGTTYETFTDTWTTNPAGGAWTPATVNTINGLGFDNSGTNARRITQGYIQVSYDAANDPYQMFEYASAFVMAAYDGTTANIDSDGNGTTDYTATLNAGGSYMLSSTTTGVNLYSNARITSNLPIQVNMITGDIDSSNKYENRWFNIPPTNLWGSSYVTPVASPDTTSPSNVFIYNPDQANPITVYAQTSSGTTSFTVAAAATYQYTMPVGSGARFYTTTDADFLAVGTVDSANVSGDDGRTWDWGYTLVAEEQLAPMLAVGWAPGSNAVPPANNGSPVYVSAAAATTVYVDYDGDPTTGANVDINGNHYDTSYAVSALQSIKIYDPDNDQTGMRVYTVDGTLLTAAWGEDPAVAGAGNPYLDMGYVVFPLPQMSFSKTGLLDVSVTPPSNEASVGDVINYTLTAKNTGTRTLTNVTIVDPKLGTLNCTPSQPATLAMNQTLVCTGSYTLTQADLDAGVVYNTATADSSQTPPIDRTVNVPIPKIAVNKTANPTTIPETGAYVTFTYTVYNNHPTETLKILSLKDDVFGTLAGDADCQVNTVLQPQTSCNFAVTQWVTGNIEGSNHINIFTVVGQDSKGTYASASDDATVQFTGARDYGDLPDTFNTLFASNGPRHAVFPDTNSDGLPNSLANGTAAIWLGGYVENPDSSITYGPGKIDTELTGVPTADATGDDTNAAVNDEDGVLLNAFVDYSHEFNLDVICTSSTPTASGWVVVWVDWNHNNSFDGAEVSAPQISHAVSCSSAGTSQILTSTFTGLRSAVYYRARLFSAQPANLSTAYLGLATNGEVEDYYFNNSPTNLTLSNPIATAGETDIKIDWATYSEMELTGFSLYHTSPLDAARILVCAMPAQKIGKPMGASYSCTDSGVQPGVAYTYWLDVHMKDGSTATMDPTTSNLALSGIKTYLPAVQR